MITVPLNSKKLVCTTQEGEEALEGDLYYYNYCRQNRWVGDEC